MTTSQSSLIEYSEFKEAIEQFEDEHDIAHCPQCGYEYLRSWKLNRCPRCGLCLGCEP
jgi:rubrerythrin